MVDKQHVATFFILICWSFAATAGWAQSQENYLAKGKKAAEQGNAEQALNIWLKARGGLEVPSTRIGNAYIELVAQQHMEAYYEFGTLMYQWGLSAEQVAPNKEALEYEIERMGLLVDLGTYKRWRDLWKADDPRIYKELLGYWQQHDPTQATTYNERLLEHWQRIAYARQNFNRDSGDALQADERGEIYVRYGAPDVKDSGTILFDPGMASSYINEIANTPILPYPAVGGGVVQSFVRQARNYHTNPEYEVWVYQESESRPTKNIFIFGNSSETAGFERIQNVEELISNRAFSMSPGQLPTGAQFSQNPRIDNIRPGLILQIIYYNELSTIDPFFGKTFDQIVDRAISADTRPVSVGLSQQMLTQAKFDLQSLNLKAPQEASTDAPRMVNIPVNVYQYRLLDENNNPYFATFVETKPQKAFWLDYLSNYSEKDSARGRTFNKQEFKQYEYTQTVQLYNQENELQSQLSANPVIVTESGDASLTVMSIPAIAEDARQVFTAKLANTDPESQYAVQDLTYKKSVRGLGKAAIEQPAPLANNPDELQMGEIILGYNYETSAGSEAQFPFTVANKKQIPQDKDLVVHVEVYHMNRGDGGNYNARLSYQVRPKSGILDWFKKQEDNLTLTLNLESGSPRYVENLQVQTRELKSGTYNMQLTVKDPRTGRQVKRNFEFEVMELP